MPMVFHIISCHHSKLCTNYSRQHSELKICFITDKSAATEISPESSQGHKSGKNASFIKSPSIYSNAFHFLPQTARAAALWLSSRQNKNPVTSLPEGASVPRMLCLQRHNKHIRPFINRGVTSLRRTWVQTPFECRNLKAQD